MTNGHLAMMIIGLYFISK